MTVSGLVCALRYFHSLLRGENFVFKTKTNRIHSRHVKRKTNWCVHIFLQLVHNFVFINTFLSDRFLTLYLQQSAVGEILQKTLNLFFVFVLVLMEFFLSISSFNGKNKSKYSYIPNACSFDWGEIIMLWSNTKQCSAEDNVLGRSDLSWKLLLAGNFFWLLYLLKVSIKDKWLSLITFNN